MLYLTPNARYDHLLALPEAANVGNSVNDAFGHIYEYFLGEFARSEGQKGGEFYTPGCIVRFLAEGIRQTVLALSPFWAFSIASEAKIRAA